MKTNKYTITENSTNNTNFLINGIEVPNEIFEEEKVGFKIINREEFLNDLINWISECKNSDKELMKNDLFELAKIDDEFILSSIETNHYLYADTEEFNNKCEEILELIN